MSRLSRVFAVILCLMLILSSCGKNAPATVTTTATTTTTTTATKQNVHPDKMGKEVLAPVKETLIYYKNPVQFVYEKNIEKLVNGQTIAGGILSKIKGLKDSKISDKIVSAMENKIIFLIEKLNSDLGIADYAFEVMTDFDPYELYNYNNVISFNIIINVSKGDFHTPVQAGMTVDLNTGEEIALKHIFADNVDYKKILNQYVALELLKNDYESQFSGEFKGITEDSAFIINSDSFTLYCPEFNILNEQGSYINSVKIPFSKLNKNIAIYQKFLLEKNLYDNSIPTLYKLKEKNLDYIYSNKGSGKFSYGDVVIGTMNVKNESKALINRLKKMQIPPNLEKYKRTPPVEHIWYSYKMIIKTYGNFLSINMYESEGFSDRKVIDRITGKDVPLSDIFIKGFDYMQAIKENIKKQIQLENNQEINFNEKDIKLSNIKFQLSNDGITIFINKFLADKKSGIKYDTSYLINYSDFGIKNIVLFN